MIRNSAQAIIGTIIDWDFVQDAEVQAFKKWVGDEFSLLHREPIMVHIAEVFCQYEGTNFADNG